MTQVDVWDVEGGPASIESITEEYLSVPGTLARAQEGACNGVDGIILGCFGDPGVDVQAALKLVEAQVAMRLAHSTRAYPHPPKTVPLEANRT